MEGEGLGAPAGWYPDPLGLPQLRWWDGRQWSEHISAQDAPAAQRSGFDEVAAEYTNDPLAEFFTGGANNTGINPIVPAPADLGPQEDTAALIDGVPLPGAASVAGALAVAPGAGGFGGVGGSGEELSHLVTGVPLVPQSTLRAPDVIGYDDQGNEFVEQVVPIVTTPGAAPVPLGGPNAAPPVPVVPAVEVWPAEIPVPPMSAPVTAVPEPVAEADPEETGETFTSRRARREAARQAEEAPSEAVELRTAPVVLQREGAPIPPGGPAPVPAAPIPPAPGYAPGGSAATVPVPSIPGLPEGVVPVAPGMAPAPAAPTAAPVPPGGPVLATTGATALGAASVPAASGRGAEAQRAEGADAGATAPRPASSHTNRQAADAAEDGSAASAPAAAKQTYTAASYLLAFIGVFPTAAIAAFVLLLGLGEEHTMVWAVWGAAWLIGLLLAFNDRLQLKSWGHRNTANPLLALFTPILYLVARSTATKGETGHGQKVLVYWIIALVLMAGIVYLVPGVMSATIPGFTPTWTSPLADVLVAP